MVNNVILIWGFVIFIDNKIIEVDGECYIVDYIIIVMGGCFIIFDILGV